MYDFWNFLVVGNSELCSLTIFLSIPETETDYFVVFFQTPLSWNNFFGGMGGGTDSSSWVLGDNFGGESPLAWKINLKLFQNNHYKSISISRDI